MTHEDDATLLERYHTRPGRTAVALTPFLTSEGRSSYDVLAAEANSLDVDAAVLDLACGDGFLLGVLRDQGSFRLTGVDRSAEELAAARERLGAGVELVCSDASSLPLSDGSVDLVVCHMALMLMNSVGVVLSEIYRILKPGGRFAAVLPRRHPNPAFDAAWEESRRVTAELGLSPLQIGPADIHSPKALMGYLGAAGFDAAQASLSDFEVRAQMPSEGFWSMFEGMYNVFRLPVPSRAALKEALVPKLNRLLDKEGQLTAEMGMRLVACQKNQGAESSKPPTRLSA